MKDKGFILVDALIVVILVLSLTFVFAATNDVKKRYEEIAEDHFKDDHLKDVDVRRCEGCHAAGLS